MIKYPIILNGVVPTSNLKAAKQMVSQELESLRRDYYPNQDMQEFLIDRIYPDSIFKAVLQQRCIYRGIMKLLVSEDLVRGVRDHIDQAEIVMINYLRIGFPEMKSSESGKIDNALMSCPHYDEYGADIVTTWIPFHDIDSDTGGFSFSENKVLAEYAKSIELQDDFHKGIPECIDLIRTEMKEIHCKAGDVIMFDRHVLHGGTYAKNKMRMSFDMRWARPTCGIRLYNMCRVEDVNRLSIGVASRNLINCCDFEFLVRSVLQ